MTDTDPAVLLNNYYNADFALTRAWNSADNIRMMVEHRTSLNSQQATIILRQTEAVLREIVAAQESLSRLRSEGSGR